MAWISVDQKLIGGKLRKLHKEIGCSRHEAIGILVSLWLWGLDNAEPDGLITNADADDIAEVLKPGLENTLDPDEVVKALIETGWIDQEERSLYFHDWSEWRKYYNKFVKDRESNKKRQAEFRAKRNLGKDNVMYNGESNVTVTEEEKDNQKPKRQSQAEKYGEEFEAFWKIYPRRDDKAEAFEKFKARVRDGFPPEQLIEAARNYAARCQRERTEAKYIKQGKTFLSNKLSFTDYFQGPGQDFAAPYAANQDPYEGQYQRTDPGQNPFRRS